MSKKIALKCYRTLKYRVNLFVNVKTWFLMIVDVNCRQPGVRLLRQTWTKTLHHTESEWPSSLRWPRQKASVWGYDWFWLYRYFFAFIFHPNIEMTSSPIPFYCLPFSVLNQILRWSHRSSKNLIFKQLHRTSVFFLGVKIGYNKGTTMTMAPWAHKCLTNTFIIIVLTK